MKHNYVFLLKYFLFRNVLPGLVNSRLKDVIPKPDTYVFMTSNMETDYTLGIAYVGAICKLVEGQRTSINEYPPDTMDDIGAAEV